MSAQLAQALRGMLDLLDDSSDLSRRLAIKDAREALAALEAAPQQEPAIIVTIDDLDLVQDWAESRLPPGTHKLYAAPQQEPVAEVYRAHPGGRSRNIGLNDVRPLRGATLPPPGTKLYAAPQQAQAPRQEPDKLDAQRYRWLRDKSTPPHNFYLSVPVEFDGVRYTPNEVDEYIDAARKAQS